MTLLRLWGFPLLCLGLALEIIATHSNVALFLRLNHASQALSPFLWSHLTALGDAALTPLCLLPWWRKRPDLLWAGLLAALLAFAFSHGLKHEFNAPRPPAVVSVMVIGPRLLHGSFPSGHTTTIFTMVGLMVLGLPLRTKQVSLVAILLATAVGYSRLALGVHWPLDVLVGAAGGWLCAAGGLAWARHWPHGQRYGYRVAFILLLGLALYGLGRGPDGLPGVYWSEKLAIIALLGWAWLRRKTLA